MTAPDISACSARFAFQILRFFYSEGRRATTSMGGSCATKLPGHRQVVSAVSAIFLTNPVLLPL